MTEDAQEVVALDGAEITRRVEALLPEIDGRADEIAQARRLPRDLVDALKTAGVFRMSMPEAWGGSALPLPDQVRIVESLAYTDPSVGWCVMIGSDSGFYSAFLDDASARELDDGGDEASELDAEREPACGVEHHRYGDLPGRYRCQSSHPVGVRVSGM